MESHFGPGAVDELAGRWSERKTRSDRLNSPICGRKWFMNLQVLVLGAGFGGLELSTILSESLADNLELTLIDKSDSFVFGYSKLDVMYGRKAPDAVRVS